MASQNPFDLFFYSKNFNGCIESKLIKNEYQAFSFSLIKPHQITNLDLISQICKIQSFPVYTLICLGIWIPRKEIDLFFFDISFILDCINTGKKSVLKKELLDLKSKGKFISMKKQIFDVNEIPKKVIYKLEGV
jgi:hypothetical protein